jgi:hypothetical protein
MDLFVGIIFFWPFIMLIGVVLWEKAKDTIDVGRVTFQWVFGKLLLIFLPHVIYLMFRLSWPVYQSLSRSQTLR